MILSVFFTPVEAAAVLVGVLIILIPITAVTGFAPPEPSQPHIQPHRPFSLPFSSSSMISSALQQAKYPWEDEFSDLKLQSFQDEETLLQMHCKCMSGQSLHGTVLPKVQKYVQSFPFAAVLPVQPLQYLPTKDGGVEVLFLRKKTEEKSSIDGGLRFFVLPDNDDNQDQDHDQEENDDDNYNNNRNNKGLEILVKRYSQGQTVGKMFAEKLVVQAFVKAITGNDTEGKIQKEPPTVDAITVESVFHKWMDVEP